MVDHELIERVTQLSVSERIELIELLRRSLRSDIPLAWAARDEQVPLADTVRDRSIEQAAPHERAAALTRLFGALSADPGPPTDKEWKEAYISYLTRKYE